MADYVQPSIDVAISEKCFDKALYIHFGRFLTTSIGQSQYVNSIHFDKKFKIDESKTIFPDLCTKSVYDKSKLSFKGNGSEYLGSKESFNENTLISIIYPNDLLNDSYKIVYVTGSSNSPDDIQIPESYQYSLINLSKEYDSIDMVNRICKLNESNWIYLIDCQKITNVWNSYIVHFYLSNSKDISSIQDISIKLHTIDENAHLNNLSKYSNEIATQNNYSYYVLNNGLNTSFSKMNGLLTANPLQYRLNFFGTPYGYNLSDVELVEKYVYKCKLCGKEYESFQDALNCHGQSPYEISIDRTNSIVYDQNGFYSKFKDFLRHLSIDESFGKNAIIDIDELSGIYKLDDNNKPTGTIVSMSESDAEKRYERTQLKYKKAEIDIDKFKVLFMETFNFDIAQSEFLDCSFDNNNDIVIKPIQITADITNPEDIQISLHNTTVTLNKLKLISKSDLREFRNSDELQGCMNVIIITDTDNHELLREEPI